MVGSLQRSPALAVAGVVALSTIAGAAESQTLVVEAEDFQFRGGWRCGSDGAASGRWFLMVMAPENPGADALTLVHVPVAGTYRVWTRSKDYTTIHPRTRLFRIVIDGNWGDRYLDCSIASRENTSAGTGSHGICLPNCSVSPFPLDRNIRFVVQLEKPGQHAQQRVSVSLPSE